MSVQAPARPLPRAVFTQGSTLRHVLVMTATGSIGLMAIFVVDLLSLLYISRLGDPSLTAGIGFATQVTFLAVSLNIGMSIGVSAVVSRALGAGDRPLARRLSLSGLALTFLLASVVGVGLFPFRENILTTLGARGAALEAGSAFLALTLPTSNLMALGIVLAGLLRAAGDARRSMYVTLFGAFVTAAADPILILYLRLGAVGAAISTDISRVVWIGVGAWGAIRVHDLVARPARGAIKRDAAAILAIAGPAMLTNLAAPVSSLYSVSVMSRFGESAVAAASIVDRIVPVAFGALFAMSGVVGPIIGQNHGAGRIDRVRETLTDCFAFSAVYVGVAWFALYLATPFVLWVFNAHDETAELVAFFCAYGAMAWAFLGCLFAANAAFNNLGYATLSTAFNWGRATLGFIPFVTLGAAWYGPRGVFIGTIAGALVFGTGAIACAYWITGRLAKRPASAPKMS